MPSETSEKRATKASQLGAPPPEPEHLPCPRCDSTNTKFCYYNNYNFSQPRHFCKACRRYWTHGGTLRDIPVGGGSRKNAKRSRTITTTTTTSSTATSSSAFTSASHDHYRHLPSAASSLLMPFSATDHGGAVPFVGDMKPSLNMCGSFTSLLNTHGPTGGFFALGGFGLGLGSASSEEMGFGLGRAVWPFPMVAEGGATSGNGGPNGGGASLIGNTWQLESGDHGGYLNGGGDCFTWPDLAISTPGNAMK